MELLKLTKTQKKIQKIALMLLILLLGLTLNFQSIENPEKTSIEKILIKSLIDSPILILDNNDLESSGFPGTGTATDPYRIEEQNINTNTETAIEIRNTDKYVVIRNNQLSGTGEGSNYAGIFVKDAKNLRIINNDLVKFSKGIELDNTHFSSLDLNRIIQCESGVYVHKNSSNNEMSSNSLHESLLEGIGLETNANNNFLFNNSISDGKNGNSINLREGYNNTLKFNSIARSANNGIYLFQTQDNKLIDNQITETPEGIFLSHSDKNQIKNNYIQSTTLHPLALYMATENIFAENTLVSDQTHAIAFADSHKNYILNNTIYVTQNYGISIYSPSSLNIIKWNSFIGTTWSGGDSLAKDEGIENHFEYNYWEGWTTPDQNKDQIVDLPYPIDGPKNNWDNNPLVYPNLHILSLPTIVYPNNGETISGIIKIIWNASIDPWGHKVSYSLYYTLQESYNSPVTLADKISETFFLWNTTDLIQEYNVQLTVKASCSGGLFATDITDRPFTINNWSLHYISTISPTLNLIQGYLWTYVLAGLVFWYCYKQKNKK